MVEAVHGSTVGCTRPWRDAGPLQPAVSPPLHGIQRRINRTVVHRRHAAAIVRRTRHGSDRHRGQPAQRRWRGPCIWGEERRCLHMGRCYCEARTIAAHHSECGHRAEGRSKSPPLSNRESKSAREQWWGAPSSPPPPPSLGAAACYLLFMLTAALLMTCSHRHGDLGAGKRNGGRSNQRPNTRCCHVGGRGDDWFWWWSTGIAGKEWHKPVDLSWVAGCNHAHASRACRFEASAHRVRHGHVPEAVVQRNVEDGQSRDVLGASA